MPSVKISMAGNRICFATDLFLRFDLRLILSRELLFEFLSAEVITFLTFSSSVILLMEGETKSVKPNESELKLIFFILAKCNISIVIKIQ